MPPAVDRSVTEFCNAEIYLRDIKAEKSHLENKREMKRHERDLIEMMQRDNVDCIEINPNTFVKRTLPPVRPPTWSAIELAIESASLPVRRKSKHWARNIAKEFSNNVSHAICQASLEGEARSSRLKVSTRPPRNVAMRYMNEMSPNDQTRVSAFDTRARAYRDGQAKLCEQRKPYQETRKEHMEAVISILEPFGNTGATIYTRPRDATPDVQSTAYTLTAVRGSEERKPPTLKCVIKALTEIAQKVFAEEKVDSVTWEHHRQGILRNMRDKYDTLYRVTRPSSRVSFKVVR